MSNIFAKYRKELAGVQVVASECVWLRKKDGKSYKNPNLDIIGKIDMQVPNVILKANSPGHKTGFIEDTSALTKKTKADLIDFFFNRDGSRNKKRVAYLIRTDKASKTASNTKQSKNKK